MITRTTDTVGLTAFFRRFRGLSQRELRDAVGAQIRAMRQEAHRLSSGTYSRGQLQRLGHPYAARHVLNRRQGLRFKTAPAIPYGDAGIINKQSGTFRRSWKVGGPRFTGGRDGIQAELTNTAGHARYLFRGTDRMIPRPILLRVERNTKAGWTERIAEAFERAAAR